MTQQLNGNATVEQLLGLLAKQTHDERRFDRVVAALVLAADPEWCRQNARLIDVVRRGTTHK